jgi:hypothetical protein
MQMRRIDSATPFRRPAARSLSGAIGLALLLVLAGCAGRTALDELSGMQPTGSSFDRALYKYYSLLARSFGDVAAPPGTAFDQEGSFSLSTLSNSVSGVADTFARKALDSGRGVPVSAERAPNDAAEGYRGRLIRALVKGRDQFPDKAACAQADYDCWVLDGQVDTLAAASAQCKRSLDITLPDLETNVQRQAAPPAAAETKPVTQPQ